MTTPKVITDEDLFDTLHWLEDNARPAAQAKATRIYLEECWATCAPRWRRSASKGR